MNMMPGEKYGENCATIGRTEGFDTGSSATGRLKRKTSNTILRLWGLALPLMHRMEAHAAMAAAAIQRAHGQRSVRFTFLLEHVPRCSHALSELRQQRKGAAPAPGRGSAPRQTGRARRGPGRPPGGAGVQGGRAAHTAHTTTAGGAAVGAGTTPGGCVDKGRGPRPPGARQSAGVAESRT